MKKLMVFAMALALVVTSTCLVAPVYAQNSTPTTPVDVLIKPGTLQLGVGEVSEVAIEVQNVTGLYGIDIGLNFDPNSLEVVDASPQQAGVQAALGTFLDAGLLLTNSADNTTGRLNFVMVQANPSEPKSGTGAVLVVRLRGKKAGDSILTIARVMLASRDGFEIPSQGGNAQISVLTQVVSHPISTPFPVQTVEALVVISTLAPGEVLVIPTLDNSAAIGPQAQMTNTPLTGEKIAPLPETATPTLVPGKTTLDRKPLSMGKWSGWILGLVALLVAGLGVIYWRTRKPE